MKVILFVFCLFALANGHTYLSSVILNGVQQGLDDCIRPQWRGDNVRTFRSSPIQDVQVFPNGIPSANMTCGFLPSAAGAVNRVCNIAAGQTIGLSWRHNNANPGDDFIDGSHKGPVMAYMVKSDSGTPTNGWFKIYEDGYSNNQWASTDKLKNNNGVFTVTIPSDITPGKYLLRGEIIALHDGDKPNGAQPYVGCVEIQVSGTGNVNPPGVSIPGVYSKTEPGIAFDIYKPFSTYPIPGPRPYTAGSLTGTTGSTTTTGGGQTTTTGGGQTTTTGGAPSVTSTGGAANPCSDVNSCVNVCGQGNVKKCSCENGSPIVECNSSSASTISFAVAVILSVLAVAF